MNLEDIDVGAILVTVGPPVATIILVTLATVFAARLAKRMVGKTPGNFTRQLEYLAPKMEALEWRRQDKPTAVHFTEIGSNAFHYQCFAWIDNRLDAPGFESRMLTALVNDLNDAGISCGETGDLSMSNWPAAWDTPPVDLRSGDRRGGSNNAEEAMDAPVRA